MNNYFKTTIVMAYCCAISFTNTSLAMEKGWFIRPNIGVSLLSDQTVSSINVLDTSGIAEVNVDSGFVSGLGIGYAYSNNLVFELAWEYRSNESNVVLADDRLIEEGNYASNMFFLNTHYYFDTNSRWQPYVGAGLSWIQEIDIDLESEAGESSFATDGNIGFQLFAGLGYQLSDDWQIQAELRYGSIDDIDLTPEEGSQGSFANFDYQPTTLQVGLIYNF